MGDTGNGPTFGRRQVVAAGAFGGLALVRGRRAMAAGEAHHWTYTGNEGPDFWGDLDLTYAACSLGTLQSPVDFSGIAPSPTARLTLPTGNFMPTGIVNNGHTIQVSAPEGIALQWNGEPFAMRQFHFHTPAEHTVDGILYPLEVHLVFQAEDGSLAVLGMLIKEGEANPSLSPVFAALPEEQGPEQPLDATIDLADLIPASTDTFTYEGSLTTPPCTEGVIWNLFAAPLSITPAEADAYREIFPVGARPVQRRITAEATPAGG